MDKPKPVKLTKDIKRKLQEKQREIKKKLEKPYIKTMVELYKLNQLHIKAHNYGFINKKIIRKYN